MITIKEISEIAGTSRGTVDRVINKRGKVKPAIEQRVLEIIDEYGYRTNPYAKALVNGKREYNIGVVLNSKGNEFFEDIRRGIERGVEKYKDFGLKPMLIEIHGHSEEEQLMALNELKKQNISGLSITPLDTKSIVKTLETFHDIPIIALNQDIHFKGKLAFIGCDYLGNGQLAGDVAKLILPDGGKVVIITGSFLMLGLNERIRGFRSVIESSSNFVVEKVVENKDDNELSYKLTMRILKEDKPDLIYYCAGGQEGGVKAVADFSLANNKQTKVIVVDNFHPVNQFLKDGFIQASITQQPYEQGYAMIETMVNYLIFNKRPRRVHNYTENQIMLPHSISEKTVIKAANPRVVPVQYTELKRKPTPEETASR